MWNRLTIHRLTIHRLTIHRLTIHRLTTPNRPMPTAKRPPAGTLTKRFLVLKRTKKSGSQGQPKNKWYAIGRLRGSIHQIGGNEFEQYQAKWATATHLIKTGNAKHLTTDLRLQIGGRVLGILSVNDIGCEGVEFHIVVNELLNARPCSSSGPSTDT